MAIRSFRLTYIDARRPYGVAGCDTSLRVAHVFPVAAHGRGVPDPTEANRAIHGCLFVNCILTGTAAAAAALIAVLSCSDSSTGLDRFNADSLSVDASRLVASIEVHLASSSINAGDTTRASVTMKDRRGVTIIR